MNLLFGMLLILAYSNGAFARNNENRISTELQTLALTEPDAQGLSHNDITVNLKSNGLNKIVFVDLQFDAGSFKTMKVKLPQIAADDCKERPEIGKWMPKKNAHEPLEMYRRSYVSESDDSHPIETLFDLTEDISKGGQQTITLWFSTVSACTKLHIQLDVQFSAH
jgi:hypothetical protein